jgi:hypothetical protein
MDLLFTLVTFFQNKCKALNSCNKLHECAPLVAIDPISSVHTYMGKSESIHKMFIFHFVISPSAECT